MNQRKCFKKKFTSWIFLSCSFQKQPSWTKNLCSGLTGGPSGCLWSRPKNINLWRLLLDLLAHPEEMNEKNGKNTDVLQKRDSYTDTTVEISPTFSGFLLRPVKITIRQLCSASVWQVEGKNKSHYIILNAHLRLLDQAMQLVLTSFYLIRLLFLECKMLIIFYTQL